MKIISVFLFTLSLYLVTSHAVAEEKGAGCGIGKVVMEGKSGVGANLVAAILNTVIIPNIFFMTTGILGCDTTQTVKREEQREVFVARNMDDLSRDMARGNGEYLTALAEVMGIAAQDRENFFSFAQNNFSNVVDEEADARQMLVALDGVMLADPLLSKYVFQ